MYNAHAAFSRHSLRPITFIKLLIFFAILLFPSFLLALEVANDTFTSDSSGWTGGSYDATAGGTLRIDMDNTGTKTYTLGSSYANQLVTIDFDMILTGDWDSTGTNADVVDITINGVTSSYVYGDGTSSQYITDHHTFTTNATAAGDVTIAILSNTTTTTELTFIDNVVLDSTPLTPALSLSKSAPLTINPSASFTYSLTVQNIGLGDAVNVSITDTLPEGVTFNSSASCSATTGTPIVVSCPVGLLSAGTSQTLTIDVTAPSTEGVIVNTAVAEADNASQVQSNPASTNVSTATVPSNFTCANPKPFGPRFQTNDFGNIALIGNTSLCYNNGGVCSDPGTLTNNNINMMNNDSDNNTSYGSGTFNSSAALLNLPPGAEILWAGLYWQGYLAGSFTDAQKANGATIKFRHANDTSGYVSSVSTDMRWVYFNSTRMYYQASLDVTSYLRQFGSGYFWVADIFSTLGQPIGGSFGAWSLSVVYKDYNDKFRNMSVFDGYQAFAGGGDISNATTYASNNGCNTSNTGVGNGVTSTLSGFLTPKSGAVESRFTVFAGEGDIGLTGDTIAITDLNGTDNFLSNTGTPGNPQTNVMNATISVEGATVTTGIPYYSANSLGIDIDTYDVSNILGNKQSSTNVTLTTSGDGYMPGMYAFSTELYTPRFCYDYFYKQNSFYFTEENNGTEAPRIVGYVIPNVPIEVSVFIRNEEDADIVAQNMRMNIRDINVTQAQYVSNTVDIIEADQFERVNIPDNTSGMINTPANILNVPLGDVDGSQYIYTFYHLDPNQYDLNMSLNVDINYTMIFKDAFNNDVPLTYSSQAGNPDFPLCTNANFAYQPEWGTLNMVDTDLFATGNYYNLPTQVVRRPANFSVVTFDANDTTVEKPLSETWGTMIAVELIDAGAYHDVNESCRRPDSAFGERIWVMIDANSSQVNFNDALNAAVIDNINLDAPEDFYNNASPNTAFRFAYTVSDDGNESIVQWQRRTSPPHLGMIEILNFPEVVQVYGPSCTHPVARDPGGDPTLPSDMITTVAAACGNNGSSGLDDYGFKRCMECIFGSNTRYICSRDNFSTRPESYVVKFNDINQTTRLDTTKQRFEDNITGVVTPTINDVNLAAGYTYRYDFNATSHTDNNATVGYTRAFGTGGTDFNATFIWKPRNITAANAAAFCNDIDSYPQNFYLSNGAVTTGSRDANLTQVGEYLFNVIDTTWTEVDYDPLFMAHHSDANYFVGGIAGPDCQLNRSAVQPTSQPTVRLGNTLTRLNGCIISTTSHENNDTGMNYNDYNVTFHPYGFRLNLIASHGVAEDTNFTNAWLYMADMNKTDINLTAPLYWQHDYNQSVHMRGLISAQGYDDYNKSQYIRRDVNATDLDENATSFADINWAVADLNTSQYGSLSNFVSQCFAEDVALSSGHRLLGLGAFPTDFSYMILDRNASQHVIYASPAIDVNGSNLLSTGAGTPTLREGNFTKLLEGVTAIDLNFNFKREANEPLNPMRVNFNDLNISCNTPANCRMQADLNSSYEAEGNLTIDRNLTYYYGRLHAPRYRVEGNEGNVTLYYEIYCDQNPSALSINAANPCVLTDHNETTLPNAILSVNDIRWYRNEDHNKSEGNTTSILQRRGTMEVNAGNGPQGDLGFNGSPLQRWNFQYDQSRGYPFKATMQMSTQNWMIYHRFDSEANRTEFELEFNSAGQWTGKNAGSISVDSNASVNTNRRIEW